jgi:hypothetical protein
MKASGCYRVNYILCSSKDLIQDPAQETCGLDDVGMVHSLPHLLTVRKNAAKFISIPLGRIMLDCIRLSIFWVVPIRAVPGMRFSYNMHNVECQEFSQKTTHPSDRTQYKGSSFSIPLNCMYICLGSKQES